MELVTVQGLVATTPRHIITQDGLPITSFRLASTNGDNTNWFTITSFKDLALNTNSSVNKGDRVVVTGKLVIRDYDNGHQSGTAVEIEAISIGHDLSWGTSVFTRTVLVQQN